MYQLRIENYLEGEVYVVIQFNYPVDMEAKGQLAQQGVVFGDPIDKLSFYVKIPPSALPEVTQLIDAGKLHFVGTPSPEARVAEPLKAKINQTPQEALPDHRATV